jgi:hypothetical protein
MSFGNDPGAGGQAKRKAELFMRKADAARAARLAGNKPLIRRLLERMLPDRLGESSQVHHGPPDQSRTAR